MIGKKMVVLDLETTGFDVYNDEIIEFAAIKIQEKEEEPEILTFLCSPRQTVSGRILRLTGITQEELNQAQPIQVYREEILNFLQDAVLIGHNVDFDLGFLQHSLNIHFPNQIWDTLEMTRILYPNLPKYRLGDLIRHLDLDPIERSHRALPDVQATWNLLQKCWEKGLNLDLSFFQRAIPLLSSSKSLGFFQILEQEIKRKFPERLIPTDLKLNTDMGIFEQIEDQDEDVPTSFTWIEECFSRGGILENNLKGYESRLGQVKMAKAVGEALMNSTHLVSEAGTGTGKSYAYLIPSLWWSKKNSKKVVVATHTIPLQEQLFKKDLPILAQILPFSFRGEILKGKGNYLCLKKWLALQNNSLDLELEVRLAALSVLVWLRETEVGDYQEIAQIPNLDKIWSEINAEEENCQPGKCPQAKRCFMLQARKKAESADLIIVNHSLLFSDIKTERNILPEFHQLVIDEAHHLHQAALQQLGNEISFEEITQALNLLSRPLAGSFYGNIKFRAKFWEQALPLQIWEEFRGKLEEIPEASKELLCQAEEVFASFTQILGDEISFRLTPDIWDKDWWETLQVQIENFQGRLEHIIKILKDLYQLVASLDDEDSQSLGQEIGARMRKFEEIKECFILALQLELPTRVSWLEKSYQRLILKTAPVDVSDILREKLFQPLDSVILTSATLSISNSFDHFLQKIGLDENVNTLIVQSPFEYQEQMQLVVVQDLVKENSRDLFEPEEVAEFIAAVGERMEGRTLVLLTSHRFLREIHLPLSSRLAESDIDLLAQGIDGGRQALLESFRQNPKSILLGANSFWEGIDIPGDQLSCVILLKLPFGPPSQPLTAARSEYLQSPGKNPFYELLLPEAVIRFKQGVGRLIRSKTDRGLVIICDKRVIEKRYGRTFLNSLPLKTHVRTTQEQITDEIDIWFDEERPKDFL